MAFEPRISIKGKEELIQQFVRIAKAPEERGMENSLLEIAKDLQVKIRNKAPRGETGNLKKGVVARKFKRKIKGAPAVYVAMNRKIAPHFYLVEFGSHGIRIGKKGAESYIGRQFGVMVPRPYFRSTVDVERGKIMEKIKRTAEKVISKAKRK